MGCYFCRRRRRRRRRDDDNGGYSPPVPRENILGPVRGFVAPPRGPGQHAESTPPKTPTKSRHHHPSFPLTYFRCFGGGAFTSNILSPWAMPRWRTARRKASSSTPRWAVRSSSPTVTTRASSRRRRDPSSSRSAARQGEHVVVHPSHSRVSRRTSQTLLRARYIKLVFFVSVSLTPPP